MKKATVTGADGFIGSHLTEMLLNNGYEVTALCQYNSFNTRGWLEGLSHNRLNIVSGDIRDPNLCKTIIKGSDIVFHLAALIAIPYSYVAPYSYVDTNVNGTLNICQAIREQGGGRLLVTSTSEVYGTAQYVPIDEHHPKQPQSPYSASKIGADAIAMSFFRAFDTDVTIVRPFNTFGPRQSARAFIPSVIIQLASGKEEIQVGDLTPTRDLNYVSDTCRGFLAIAEHGNTKGEEINIATQQEHSMHETLTTIGQLMGKEVRILKSQERIRPKNSEVYRLLGSNEKIKELTGWKPEISLKDGLEQTIQWLTRPENLKLYKPDIYNI